MNCVGAIKNKQRFAFTLIELLVVIAVIGLLISIALPAAQAVREAARRVTCGNNLRQLSIASLHFESSYSRLPIGMLDASDPKRPLLSWIGQLLPFVEQTALEAQSERDFRFGLSIFDQEVHRTPLRVVACPSDARVESPQLTLGGRVVALTSFLGVTGTDLNSMDGAFSYSKAVRLADIQDGLSQTLLLGERPPSPDNWYGWWYGGMGQDNKGSLDALLGTREKNQGSIYPDCPAGPYKFCSGEIGNNLDTFHFWSLHPGGANFAFCDGSVRFLAYDADMYLAEVATRAGHEVVPSF